MLQRCFSYAFITLTKKLKRKTSTCVRQARIKPNTLSILILNPTRKPGPTYNSEGNNLSRFGASSYYLNCTVMLALMVSHQLCFCLFFTSGLFLTLNVMADVFTEI